MMRWWKQNIPVPARRVASPQGCLHVPGSASVRAYANPTALGDSKKQETDSVPGAWIRYEGADE